jgi:hypothetical protein
MVIITANFYILPLKNHNLICLSELHMSPVNSSVIESYFVYTINIR